MKSVRSPTNRFLLSLYKNCTRKIDVVQFNFVMLAHLHNICVIIGWLVLIPAGVYMSTVGKHRFPDKWFCYHRALMISAVVVIYTGVLLNWSSLDWSHMDSLQTLFDPFLNLLLLLQGIGGFIISMSETPGDHAPLLNKVHKAFGLVLYLGGLANGFIAVHAFSTSLTCAHAIYAMAMLSGIAMVGHLYLACLIIPTWSKHWCHDPQYDHLGIDVPQALP